MKTGVFGGAFNPVHRGHMALCEAFVSALELDRVLLVPSAQPVHKPAPDLAPAADRLAMLRLAAAGDPRYEVTDIELRRQEPSYTVLTLEVLRERYPGDRFHLIMGSDMLLYFRHWHRYRDIFPLAELCVASRRQEDDAAAARFAEALRAEGAKVRMLDIDEVVISSSEIREGLAAGRDMSAFLHPEVAAHIAARGLYRG